MTVSSSAHERIFGEIRSLAARTTCALEYDKLEDIFRMFPLCEEDFLVQRVFPYMRETLSDLLRMVPVDAQRKPLQIKHLLYKSFLYYVREIPPPEMLASPHWRSCKDLRVMVGGGFGDSGHFFPTDDVFLEGLDCLTLYGAFKSTDISLQLASQCPNLRELVLADTLPLGKQTYALPNLQVLRFGFEDPHIYWYLARVRAPKLKDLHLVLTMPMTDMASFQELADIKQLTVHVQDSDRQEFIYKPQFL